MQNSMRPDSRTVSETRKFRAKIALGLLAAFLPLQILAMHWPVPPLPPNVRHVWDKVPHFCIYAMFATMATAREREFGVRMALGSSRGAVAGLVIRQGGIWMALGLLLGSLGVFATTRLVRSQLIGVAAFDPLTIGAAVVVLLVCAGVALLVPVRRATRVDPITVLR